MMEIPLGRSGLNAIIDDEDYERVTQFKWCARTSIKTVYAQRNIRADNGTRFVLSLQNFILGLSRSAIVDHRDRNGLNNVRSNLRPCTSSQNMANRAPFAGQIIPYKGVSPRGRRFCALITPNRTRIYLGCFDTPEEAALAYDTAAKQFFGEFAYLNFPDHQHSPRSDQATLDQELENCRSTRKTENFREPPR